MIEEQKQKIDTMNGRIAPFVVCAAIKSNISGYIVVGARHFDDTMRAHLIRIGAWKFDEDGHPHGFVDEWKDYDDGFIDQYGNFLTREEAWIIAGKNRQVKQMVGGNVKKVLYSENLY